MAVRTGSGIFFSLSAREGSGYPAGIEGSRSQEPRYHREVLRKLESEAANESRVCPHEDLGQPWAGLDQMTLSVLGCVNRRCTRRATLSGIRSEQYPRLCTVSGCAIRITPSSSAKILRTMSTPSPHCWAICLG
jgi:hypothetical protein